MNTKARIAAISASLLIGRTVCAVSIGQADNFQDGTTMNWVNGGVGGAPPVTNIANGGPAGAGDHYIQVTADGSGAGGKLTTQNRDQWLGDYVVAGVTSIQVDLLNQSSVSLSIRLAFKTSPGNPVAGFLTQAVVLPVGSGWTHATFSLNPADLIPINNPGPWDQFYIEEVRFIQSAAANSLSGTTVVGQLGIDNVRAVPEPSTAALLVMGGAAAAIFVRLKRAT